MITTELYFIAMAFALLSFPVIFILLLEFLLVNYRDINVKKIVKNIFLNRYLPLLAIAFTLPLVWQFIPLHILKTREVNFAQHALGGGFAVAVCCIYIILYYKDRFVLFTNSLFQFLFIYFTVSAFGVLNELLEFTLDFLDMGIFSADRYDTWYDMVANTSGALAAFVIFLTIKILYKIYKFLLNKF
jgi:hypothetical protein